MPPPNAARRRVSPGIAVRLLTLVALTMLPVLVIVWRTSAAERREAEVREEESLLQRAASIAAEYDETAREISAFLTAITASSEVRDMMPGACAILTEVSAANPRYLSMALVRPDGSFACQTVVGADPSVRVADRAWVGVPLRENRPAFEIIPDGRISRQPTLVVGVPVRRRSDGEVVGVVGAGLRLTNFEAIREAEVVPPSVDVHLFARDGVLVSRPDLGRIGPSPTESDFLESGESTRVVRLEDEDGVRLVALARTNTVSGLAVALGVGEDALFGPIDARFRTQLVAILALLGGSVLVAWGLSLRWLARPLSAVLDAAESLGRGDLQARAPSDDGPQEVRRLGEAFNAMAQAVSYREHVLLRTYSELKQTNEQLAQAQKMEALGHLTGGIAHDFNNLLMVIGGNLQLALEEGNGAIDNDLLREALRAADTGAEVTRRLLAFARKQPLTITTEDVCARCLGMGALLYRSIGDQVEVRFALDPDPVVCGVDANQLESVILNLAINARDAMRSGGRLTIRVRPVEVVGHFELEDGPYGVVEIEDTGCGMSEEIMSQAAEPFFTTKERGHGTGLGLSGAVGFAHQSGGTLEIESTEGVGTTVRIYLQRVVEPADEAAPAGSMAPAV